MLSEQSKGPKDPLRPRSEPLERQVKIRRRRRLALRKLPPGTRNVLPSPAGIQPVARIFAPAQGPPRKPGPAVFLTKMKQIG